MCWLETDNMLQLNSSWHLPEIVTARAAYNESMQDDAVLVQNGALHVLLLHSILDCAMAVVALSVTFLYTSRQCSRKPMKVAGDKGTVANCPSMMATLSAPVPCAQHSSSSCSSTSKPVVQEEQAIFRTWPQVAELPATNPERADLLEFRAAVAPIEVRLVHV